MRRAKKPIEHKIRLACGKYMLVSAHDFEWVREHKWHLSNGYAARSIRISGRRTKIFLHREMHMLYPGEWVDHVNGNKRDNRRENLRKCSPKQNAANRQVHNSTGFKGVHRNPRGGTFFALISGRYLGSFGTAAEAGAAYARAANELFGDFANTTCSNSGQRVETKVDC